MAARTITDEHGTAAHFRYDAFGQVQKLEFTSTVSAGTALQTAPWIASESVRNTGRRA